MAALIALLIFVAVTLIVLSLMGEWRNPVQDRLQGLRQRLTITEGGQEGPDFTIPFTDRVVFPLLDGLSRRIMAVMPPGLLAQLRQMLIVAGNPMSMTGFLTLWLVMVTVFPGMLLLASAAGGISASKVLFLVLLILVGGVMPILWLRSSVQRRQSRILRALPDAIDLVTTCVEAGLGLDAALGRVAQRTKGPLAEELSQALREMAMGRMRRDALRDLGQRTGVADLISFVHALIQAEQLGVSIGQTLRVQADQMRMRRRQRAEQQAYQAPVKMVFPLVLLIFPALIVVILGPAILTIVESLGPALSGGG